MSTKSKINQSISDTKQKSSIEITDSVAKILAHKIINELKEYNDSLKNRKDLNTAGEFIKNSKSFQELYKIAEQINTLESKAQNIVINLNEEVKKKFNPRFIYSFKMDCVNFNNIKNNLSSTSSSKSYKDIIIVDNSPMPITLPNAGDVKNEILFESLNSEYNIDEIISKYVDNYINKFK